MKTTMIALLLTVSSLSFAQDTFFRGGESGGGGDPTEVRVNEIRADILEWIKANGPKDLKLPSGVSLDDYKERMTYVLQPRFVIIGFAENDSSIDPELRVSVNGRPKTCRSFISAKDKKPHILCNIARFKGATEADQYRLVHHEYAGLASLEKNNGAASDYEITNQITDYLKISRVLKLAVKDKNIDPIDLNKSFYNDYDLKSLLGVYNCSVELIFPFIFFETNFSNSNFDVAIHLRELRGQSYTSYRQLPIGRKIKLTRVIDSFIYADDRIVEGIKYLPVDKTVSEFIELTKYVLELTCSNKEAVEI